MKLSSKYLFTTLFVLSGAVSIWISALFFSKLIMYLQFSHHTMGKAIEWGVLSLDETHHRVCVDYSFQIESRAYTAQHMFLKPNYPSREAAGYAKEAMEKEVLDVWYMWRSKGHEPISIVDRVFPYNEMFRFLIVLAILSYFAYLRRYFSHFSVREDETVSATSK